MKTTIDLESAIADAEQTIAALMESLTALESQAAAVPFVERIKKLVAQQEHLRLTMKKRAEDMFGQLCEAVSAISQPVSGVLSLGDLGQIRKHHSEGWCHKPNNFPNFVYVHQMTNRHYEEICGNLMAYIRSRLAEIDEEQTTTADALAQMGNNLAALMTELPAVT